MDFKKLESIARNIRSETIKELYAAQSGHPGSSLSIIDILTVLYFGGVLEHNPKDPKWKDRDYFLLSVGHAVPGLYACLALAGYYPVEKLNTLRKINSPLHGHPKRGTFPGVEMSSGSLGQGLSVGIGMALGFRTENTNNRVYVLMSDGEQEEGSVWEAVMFASSHKLNNITAIIDNNESQINGPTSKIMPSLEPIEDKYKAFGWDTKVIDGHNINEIQEAFKGAKHAKKPVIIIANTKIGKGVSFMEGDYHWHHGKLTDEQYKKAMEELK